MLSPRDVEAARWRIVSAGPQSAVPEPEIAFAAPYGVSAADGALYVADAVNRRVVEVRLSWSDQAECAVP